MTKKIISAEADHFTPSDLDGSIQNSIKYLRELLKKHGKDAWLEYDENFYYDYDPNPSHRISVMIKREETDVEYTNRTAYEAKWAADQAERDRVQYEALKKKFEGK